MIDYFKMYSLFGRKSHQHPFVKGIGNGELELDKFQFYIIQDYLYLIEYAKVYALGVVKAKRFASNEQVRSAN
ncbi:hypothetical protein GCM10020331_082230 [Ectobacillus funiculus]